jgi:predicted PurR-regulated permease PerM
MNETIIYRALLKFISTVLLFAVVLYLFYALRSIFLYVILGGILALLGKPIVRFLSNRLPIPSVVAVILTLLFQMSILIGVAALLIPIVITQGDNLSLLEIDALEKNVSEIIFRITDFLSTQIPASKAYLESLSLEDQLLSSVDLNFIPNLLSGLVGALGELSIGFFSVLFISFFFLKDQKLLQSGILVFIPKEKEAQTINSIEKISQLLTRYFSGILLQLTILFIVYSITLLIGGVDNAIIIALLCAIFNIIPYIGPLIGGILMLLLTLISYLDTDFYAVALPKLAYVAAGIVIGQLIDNFFSQPFIYAKSVKSHPLEIFLVILSSGVLFGILGMVVAIPAYTAIKVVLSIFFSNHSFVIKLTKGI